MSWTEDDPGAGDVGGLRVAASRLDAAARALSDVLFDVRGGAGTLTDEAWGGVAGEAWRVSAQACERNLSGLIEASASGSSALVTYAGQVEQIAEEAVRVRRQRQDAVADLAAVTFFWAPPPVRRGQPVVVTPAERARQERRRLAAQQDAQRAVSSADRAMAELVDRRRSADSQVRGALGDVSVGEWQAVGRASIAAGIVSPSGVGGAATSRAMVTLAQDVLDGNAPMGDLARLLQAWGGDRGVLSGFFRSLGGGATAALVDALSGQLYDGSIGPDVAGRYAQTLVSSMSVASRDWTAGQARVFTDQLLEHGRWSGALGVLFSSAATAPMGESFTLAVADRLDARERVGGNLVGWVPSGGHLLATVLFPERAGRGADPMSGVLETLGRYPQAALDWVLEGASDTSAPRIEYWVGERDWSRSDGFLGVSVLWSGLQQQPGGPLDVERYDSEVWKRLAQANTAFGRGLSENPQALPEHFSVEAQVRLGVALGQMMPLLAYAVEVDPPEKKLSDTRPMFVWASDGSVVQEERPFPQLTRKQIGSLFGLVGSSPEGSAVLREGVAHTQSALMNAALVSWGYDPDTALGLVADLQAILNGSLVGSIGGIEQRAKEQVEAAVSGATEVIGLVPVPGSKWAAGRLTELGSAALGETVARWAAGQAMGKVDGAVRSAAVDGVQAWMTDRAVGSALEGSWSAGPVTDPDAFCAASRAALQEELDDWIAVFRDAAQGQPVTEFTRHVDQDSQALTGHYKETFDAGRSAAMG